MLENTAFIKSAPAGVKATIQNAIKNFARKVREVFAMLTGGNRESRALRELKDGMYRYVDNLQKLWDVAAEEMVSAEQGEQNQQDVQQTVQYSVRKDYLLSKAEYARLQSNLNDQRYGYKFKSRPNGGKMVAMDNLLVYTDRKGTPEHALEVDDTDVWAINDIQQLMMQLEEDGTDYEVQQGVLRGVYPEASAHFRSGGERTRIGGKDGTGTGRNARSDGERDRGEVSAERKGVRNQYALRDTEYLNAVEAGDTAEAQRMVDEAAEQAFSKSKIRGADGKLLKVYHGTNAEFTVFDTSKQGGVNGTVEGYGIYLSDNQDVTKNYGERQIGAYANITNPATSWKKTITQAKLAKLIKASCTQEAQRMVDDGEYGNVRDAMRDTWVSNYTDTYSVSIETAIRDTARSILDVNDDDMSIVREVMAGMAIRSYRDAERFYREILTPATGIDGFWTTWENREGGADSNIILAMNSNQIKDASPVTYDDAGEVIPLSERFNASEQDIRYARRAQNQLTQKQYEAYGWVRENNILSKQAYSSLMSKYSAIKSKTANAHRTPDGYYIVDTGDEFGINKYLVLMKGSIAVPVIEDIYCINLDNETMIDVVRRNLYGELSRTGTLSHQTRDSFDQFGLVDLFTRGGSKSYSAYAREYATGRTASGREGTVGADQYGDLRGGHAGESGVRYARRDDMTMADVRDIISGMDITDSMNETEKDLLTRYKNHLAEMQRIQGEIDSQQAVIDSDTASAEEKIIAENRKKALNRQRARENGYLRRAEGSDGYYIHDAVTVEKRNFLPNKSGLVTAGEKAPTLAIILSDLANYNREFAKDGRDNPVCATTSKAASSGLAGGGCCCLISL